MLQWMSSGPESEGKESADAALNSWRLSLSPCVLLGESPLLAPLERLSLAAATDIHPLMDKYELGQSAGRLAQAERGSLCRYN